MSTDPDNMLDVAIIRRENKRKRQKDKVADSIGEINLYEERLLKLNIRKLGQLLDEEMELEYESN